MRELKYDIGLNDDGNPFVDISKDYEDNPEDKFVAFELTKYILMNISPKIKNEETISFTIHHLVLLRTKCQPKIPVTHLQKK